jgi:hypothetical protein
MSSNWTLCSNTQWTTLWSAPTVSGVATIWAQQTISVDYQFWGVNIPYGGSGTVLVPADSYQHVFVQLGPSGFVKIDVKPHAAAYLRIS